jgi:hypothetical protein
MGSTMKRLVLLAVFATVGAVSSAHAYCRAKTCGKKCELDPSTECPIGQPIRWPQLCVSFSMQYRASRQMDLETATRITERSFAAWQDIGCPGGGAPSIHLANSFGVVACSRQEYNRLDGNANIVVFHDDEWTHTDKEDALAVTTVTFDTRTGNIYDADIEVDARQTLSADIAVDPQGFDLQSILTHEAGHFLGLAHSPDPGATMWESYKPDGRNLGQDDVDGICTIYPPTDLPNVCDFTPHQGFSPECGIYPSTVASCSLASSGSTGARRAPWLSVLALVALSRRRGRRG